MTTDRFPKICALAVETAGGHVRLGACAKGAGMISPAMATMLCVVTTDAVLTPEEMQVAARRRGGRLVQPGHRRRRDEHQRLGVLPRQRSLGRAAGGRQIWARVAQALEAMLLRLALMMVADGEGATQDHAPAGGGRRHGGDAPRRWPGRSPTRLW